MIPFGVGGLDDEDVWPEYNAVALVGVCLAETFYIFLCTAFGLPRSDFRRCAELPVMPSAILGLELDRVGIRFHG